MKHSTKWRLMGLFLGGLTVIASIVREAPDNDVGIAAGFILSCMALCTSAIIRAIEDR